MSSYDDIEDAVRALIVALEEGGAPLFASVTGGAGGDWRSHLAALERLAAPAVMIAADGRAKAGDDGIPTALRVNVYVAARGLRSSEAARRGDVDTRGAWMLAERVAAALDGVVVASAYRLAAVDEDVLAADERRVAVVLRFLAIRAATLAAPTVGGAAVAGDDSAVAVQVGPYEARAGVFPFPGIDGVFRQLSGTAARSIVWSGTLRGGDHAALNALEQNLENMVADGVPRPVSDGYGRVYPHCVATAFVRRGSRRVHPASGVVAQIFELRFEQAAA